ncbi:MAG TPA: tetratricopeptide repeat protein [Thermodesulfobacteriota bacterium]|nr:tetratricopeptide repeat protein [Thermodesulfobacteriota bacterium]
MSPRVPNPPKTQSPILGYVRTSGVLFSLFLWANHIFLNYRVAGNILLAFLPIMGSITMYLWVILVADEFLLLESSERISRILRILKHLCFGVAIFYGALALGLWVNGMNHSPTVSKRTKIVSLSDVDIGLQSYRHLTITGWDADHNPRTILSNDKDDLGLHAGGDIEILLSEGALSLHRIIAIKQDKERFHLKMLTADPDSKVALAGLVEIYSRGKDFGKALELFDQLYDKYPTEADIGQDLAARLIDSRNYEQAAGVLKKLVETKKDYELQILLGQALIRAGKRDEAEKYLEEAQQLDPTDIRALFLLGYIYRDTGRKEEAKEAWTRVLELYPNFAQAEKNIESLQK